MSDLETWDNQLTVAISKAQDPQRSEWADAIFFEQMLNSLLELTNSEFGFIGKILHDETGAPFLRMQSITDITLDQQSQKLFDEISPTGMEFYDLDTLFGACIKSEKPVIYNSPATDPLRGGFPPGHPRLDAILAVPIHAGGSIVGMIGAANRLGGYPAGILDDLESFLRVCETGTFGVGAHEKRGATEEDLPDDATMALAIVDRLGDGVLVLDMNAIIIYANPAAEKMFGYSTEALKGRPYCDLVPKERRVEARKAMLAAIANPGPTSAVPLAVSVEHSNGVVFSMEIEGIRILVNDRRYNLLVMRELMELRAATQRADGVVDALPACNGQMVGQSLEMRRVNKIISEVAAGEWNVLIEGETGTGKELAAREIHAKSPRCDKPFVVVNTSSLSESLITSLLFGHRRGAFTGALQDQKGFFAAAEGGTLFLDEIAGISEAVQLALLRVLDTKEIVRVGDVKVQKVDVRVVTASNQNLEQMVKDGRFREDLFYRLRIGRVVIPPLRNRREDIVLLIDKFLDSARRVSRGKFLGCDRSAMMALSRYNWPGNVRELQSAIVFASIHAETNMITLNDLPPEIFSFPFASSPLPPASKLNESESHRINDALRQSHGNRTRAAHELGMSRATLYRRLALIDEVVPTSK